LSQVGADGGTTIVDHNTVWGTGPSSTTVVSMSDVTGLCFRNNVLFSSDASLGLALDDVTFSASCGVASVQNNVNYGNGADCSGSQCALYCTSGGMCDRAVDPSLAWPSLCLPKANALVDSGLKLGYDMWDGDVALYNGLAPDVGARESGVTRTYGGTASSCP